MDAYVLSWLGKRTPPCFQRVVSLFSPCFSLLFAFGEICLSALFLTVIARSHSIAFPVFLGKSPCFRGKTGGDGVSAISRTSFKVAGTEVVGMEVVRSIAAAADLPTKAGRSPSVAYSRNMIQFNVGVFECLLYPQHVARLFTNQLLTRDLCADAGGRLEP